MTRMMINNKDRGLSTRRMVVGIAVCFLSVIVSITVVAGLASSGTIKEDRMDHWVALAHFISSILGSSAVIGKIRENRFVISLLVGVVYIAVLLSITALFFNGEYKSVLVTMFVVISGCFAATIVNNGGRKAGKTRISRKRRC